MRSTKLEKEQQSNFKEGREEIMKVIENKDIIKRLTKPNLFSKKIREVSSKTHQGEKKEEGNFKENNSQVLIMIKFQFSSEN